MDLLKEYNLKMPTGVLDVNRETVERTNDPYYRRYADDHWPPPSYLPRKHESQESEWQ